jgi:hypothetical protein
MLATAAGGGTGIDGGGGGAFERCSALMTAKNARTEARGVLVKFARRSAEFQWEIVLIHGRQIFCLYTRQIEIRPRRGQDAGVFSLDQPRDGE